MCGLSQLERLAVEMVQIRCSPLAQEPRQSGPELLQSLEKLVHERGLPIRRIRLIVAPGDAGERIDRFLSNRGGISRGEARRALERGGVYLDGKRFKIASRLLSSGQQVEAVLEEAGRVQQPRNVELPVLYEDDWILAVSKPAGVAAQATPSGDVGTLPWLVAKHLGLKIADVATVHRLDLDTTGVVVFGKSAFATRALAAAFRENTAEKEYVAIVAGHLEGEGVLDNRLAPIPGTRGSFAVMDEGVPAKTRWRAEAHLDDAATFVRLFPETGRTHQLRVHMAHLGHPIVADRRYGGPPSAGEIEAPRMLLHARALSLPHPKEGRIVVEAPLPPDFQRAVEQFRDLFP